MVADPTDTAAQRRPCRMAYCPNDVSAPDDLCLDHRQPATAATECSRHAGEPMPCGHCALDANDWADEPVATGLVHRAEGGHWLAFNDDRHIVGCHCGFTADPDDAGYGDSVLDHFERAVRAEERARHAN